MLNHSALNRGLMFEWVQDCIDEGKPTPTDAQIMERFGFDAPEQARTLLADLADRSMITITGIGAERAISMGRRAPPHLETPRPLPTVRRPVADRADDTDNAAKIRAILRRGKDALADPLPAVEPAVVEILGEAPLPEEVPPEASEVEAPAPSPSASSAAPTPKPSGKPLPPSIANRRQLNISLSHKSFAEMERRAVAAEKMPGSYARDIVMAHLADPNIVDVSFEPGKKPRVRAAIAAAAEREGTDLYLFLTELLDRGFAVYGQDRPAVQP